MKPDAILINAARGGIIDEADHEVLAKGICRVALDVFEQEPYSGSLLNAPRCLLTVHMGSMPKDCREHGDRSASQVTSFLSGVRSTLKPRRNISATE